MTIERGGGDKPACVVDMLSAGGPLMTATATPGLDLGALGAWFAERRPAVPAPSCRRPLIAGGKSNLTYEVTDGAHEWIVRRPPLGHVLATAHDMAREYRVISALQDTGVPVPRTYALCTDPVVIGAPFYVMERVRGHAVPPRRGARAARAGTHPRDLRAAGRHARRPARGRPGRRRPGRLRPPRGLPRRARCAAGSKQLDASYSRDLPAADELHALLDADVPAESRARHRARRLPARQPARRRRRPTG